VLRPFSSVRRTILQRRLNGGHIPSTKVPRADLNTYEFIGVFRFAGVVRAWALSCTYVKSSSDNQEKESFEYELHHICCGYQSRDEPLDVEYA
jgi:hypothetical protein